MLCQTRPAGTPQLVVTSVALVRFDVVALASPAAGASTTGQVHMTVLATLAGARMAVWADLHLADGPVVGAGVTVLVVVRQWGPGRPSKGARSRATRISIRSVGAVVAS